MSVGVRARGVRRRSHQEGLCFGVASHLWPHTLTGTRAPDGAPLTADRRVLRLCRPPPRAEEMWELSMRGRLLKWVLPWSHAEAVLGLRREMDTLLQARLLVGDPGGVRVTQSAPSCIA